MCGIFGCLGKNCSRALCVENSHKQIHRGPDDFSCREVTGGFFCFTRLNVMDRTVRGRQPFQFGQFTAMTNGEVYNHLQLEKEYDITIKGHSDCELIAELYSKVGTDLPNVLDGMFASVIVDNNTGEVFIVRDHIGIIPLYWGTDDDDRLYFASEMKCLIDVCTRIEIFPPRNYYLGPPKMGPLKTWYHMDWSPASYEPSLEPIILDRIYEAIKSAVAKMIPCDSPNGFLLSGGLDSSLVAGLARSILGPDHEIHTFTIGLENAPDFKYAKEVAEHIGSHHHEFVYTVQDGIDVIPEVIKKVETYNVTTIRASTPQYLLAKMINSWGFKMVMSGEGADEAWGGYLYFHYAPNDEELNLEMIDKLSDLHFYDCLRTNKSMLSSGIETRVPFLDPNLLEVCMSIPVRMKHPKYITHNGRPIEKGILRKACDRDDLLPKSVLWRQKEQFSDSVGFSWIDGIKEHCAKMNTSELAWYRSVFDKCRYDPTTVPENHTKTVACSTPRGVSWMPEGTTQDASARTVTEVHESSCRKEVKALQ